MIKLAKRRSDQLKEENARIHKNTMERIKAEAEKRRADKREAQA